MPHGSPAPHAPEEACIRSPRHPDLALPGAALDLVLLGDLTGRYAAGSFTRLSSDGRSVVARSTREGASDHGHRTTAAIACHVARRGGTLEQLTRLLMHPDHEGGRHAQSIALRSGHARALSYVQRVWTSATALVGSTVPVGDRHHAHEDLAALRDRIETTPWRGERGRTALRVLRAHLTFAERAGGRQHSASERQTAEEAGITRQSVRAAYETVLKPQGWLRRLRVGHGREGSTWYLGTCPGRFPSVASSHSDATQFPPDPALEDWPTPETDGAADIDSTLASRLMGHDAFAHHGLGSSALLIVCALYVRPQQTARELVGTSSVSRATVYRSLKTLASHGLVSRELETWALTPLAIEGCRRIEPDREQQPDAPPQHVWDAISRNLGTAGTGDRRKEMHAAERALYLQALDRRQERRSTARFVITPDGRHVLIPALRGDEISTTRHDTAPLDTNSKASGWRVASDGRLILITPADERSYDELVAANAAAVREWESSSYPEGQDPLLSSSRTTH